MFIPKSQLPASPRRKAGKNSSKGRAPVGNLGFRTAEVQLFARRRQRRLQLIRSDHGLWSEAFRARVCGLQASRAKSNQRCDLNRISTGPRCGKPGAPNFIRPLPGAVGRVAHERFLAQAEQIVLAHEAQDVHQAVDAPEVSADPPVAIKAIFERDLLSFVVQIRFRPLRRTNFAKSIEAGSTMRCRKPFGSRCSE